MVDRRDFTRKHLDAERPRLAAERLHQRIAVEPALAAAAPAPGRDAFGRDVRKALRQGRSVEMKDVGAKPGLQRMVSARCRRPGFGGEKEIAALVESDLRVLAIGGQS